jgi:predicted GH43/DUF377 family glycosyl hydrolase
MRWEKLGPVYAPAGDQWWARAYTHLPTALPLGDGRIRVYFAGLDENRFGRIGYVDVDAADPTRVLEVGPEPVLDVGEIGTFDDCGVVPSAVLGGPDGVRLYYHGFQRTERVPYLIFAGLAEARDPAEPFVKRSRAPLLERTAEEPFIRGAPCVLAEGGGYRMWYVVCTHWSTTLGRLHYNNRLRHATSVDGVAWTPDPAECLEPAGEDEYSVGRPAVARMRDGYHLWYSSRGHADLYAIRHAVSRDGRNWERDPCGGLDRSSTGWDSEMTCYANMVEVNGRWLMFYNGNGHGRSGFGVAVLVD